MCFNGLMWYKTQVTGDFGIHGYFMDNSSEIFAIYIETLDNFHQLYLITHCGLVTPYGVRDLGRHWLG